MVAAREISPDVWFKYKGELLNERSPMSDILEQTRVALYSTWRITSTRQS
jgi:hypothetical protein